VRRPVEDNFFECYLRWREECAAVQRTYEYWQATESTQADAAFAAYHAALDREQSTAELLEELNEYPLAEASVTR
jgi:hypothetical protein